MRYSRGVVVVLAGVALAAVVHPALGAPSFLGPTGLIQTPTADALAEGEYNLAAFTLNLEEGADSDVYAANLGLTDGLEFGFARINPEDAPGETFINAKYRFQRETEEHPAVAVGVLDFTDEVDTTAYVVMSKVVGHRYETRFGEITSPRVHFGVGGGQIDGVFAGVSAALARRFFLMAEYDTADVNIGVNWAIGSSIRIHGAALDGFDDLGLGVSFNKMF